MNTPDPGIPGQLRYARRDLEIATRECLRRAAGQHGVVRLPIRLDNPPGPPAPCNAATLFQLLWSVDDDGRLHLSAMVDGLVFQEVFT